MRVQKISLLAVAVAAGLSLTACGSSGGNSGGSDSSPSSAASDTPGSQGSGGDGGSTGSTGSTGSGATGSTGQNGGQSSGAHGPTGSGRASGAGCTTAHLAFSTSGGMGEGQLIVNMKNTGSANCTLHGFPGVDLKGKDGTDSASRSKLAAPTVTLQPGAETRFTLHYPPNNSGGTGVTFTQLVVTPPNETHSTTLKAGINVPVTDGSDGPGITVDPVGTGK
ncbi:DUF4232 domain-containing protein [Streptomyces sp. SID8366]|uniref:DUF4232 domain-containing protein n=1 Tax=unclassified Streptomyces TaxID=2593676 RepID=UPI000DBACD70|nr:DUF4232 domain-containing protein [Streptomyces sp. PsTaAH-130]MYU09048.1 DUF4232 domain-containing protein [Streptomyces sp. SID8366]MYU67900.1 DUF4232 domain-containing protein [Streptomyces sp. SID69]RAJ50972.1 uncharacterized protein DUF4232 [Streptomyces sp. PsTaAH-130]